MAVQVCGLGVAVGHCVRLWSGLAGSVVPNCTLFGLSLCARRDLCVCVCVCVRVFMHGMHACVEDQMASALAD